MAEKELLTETSEKELFDEYQATGDIQTRNKIVERYLYIAEMLAKKFVGRGVEYDDLFQVASLALIKGVDRFDVSKGVKFSTFITPTIAGEIKNYFRDRSRLIHLPRRVYELKTNIKRTSESFCSEHGRNPTVHELSQILNISEEEIVSAMEASTPLSLDRPVDGDDDSETSFMDLIPDKNDAFEQLERKDAVKSALKDLTQEEQMLVFFRFGKELSQIETARRMNVSQMYISRMERKILEKLKTTLRESLAE